MDIHSSVKMIKFNSMRQIFSHEVSGEKNVSVDQSLAENERIKLCKGNPKVLNKLALLIRVYPLSMIKIQLCKQEEKSGGEAVDRKNDEISIDYKLLNGDTYSVDLSKCDQNLENAVQDYQFPHKLAFSEFMNDNQMIKMTNEILKCPFEV